MNIEFRPIGDYPTDIPHVKDSWVGSFRNSRFAGNVPNNRFREVTEDMIDQLLRRGAQAIAAVTPEVPHHVMGWIVAERTSADEPVVHYLFVRDLYRRKDLHLGQRLLAAAGIDWREKFFYTHRTPAASQFRAARWAPEISRRKEP